MSSDLTSQMQRVVEKASKVASINTSLRNKVRELEDQIVHLQETLGAMQVEH
jgi:hypothetical protein